MEILSLFFLLIIAHSVCDYALQSDTMAKGKNRNRELDLSKIPPGQKPLKHVWVYWLTSHSLIHSGGVYLVTGSIYLAIGEFVLHWLIDFLKCENITTIDIDQGLHIACKILWIVILFL